MSATPWHPAAATRQFPPPYLGERVCCLTATVCGARTVVSLPPLSLGGWRGALVVLACCAAPVVFALLCSLIP